MWVKPPPDVGGYDLAWWAVHVVPFACMVIPIQLTYGNLPARMWPADPASLRAIPFHLAIIIVWAAVGYFVGVSLVSPLYPPAHLDPTREWPDTPGVMALVTVIGTPIFLRGINYRERLRESRIRELRLQREALSGQLQALQARIEPHFLFTA